jgi:hypothetical protein
MIYDKINFTSFSLFTNMSSPLSTRRHSLSQEELIKSNIEATIADERSFSVLKRLTDK